MDEHKVTGFLGIFEDKLEKLIRKIKDEYKKPKADRNKQNLKNMAKEAKRLRKLLVKYKDDMANTCICPHCGEKFELK